MSETRTGALPEVYISDAGERITDPAYRLSGDCYLDETLWEEGTVLITGITPNQAMQPLNRAAEERIQQWLSSLPTAGRDLRLEEIVEAANMLRPREGVPQMPAEQYSAAVIALATELREKRARNQPVPGAVQQVRAPNRANMAPMGNARFSDNTRSGFGQEPAVVQSPQRRDSVVRRPAPAVGSMPPEGPKAPV